MIHRFVILSFLLIAVINWGKSQGKNSYPEIKPVVTVKMVGRPIFAEKQQNELLTFQIDCSDPERVGSLEEIQISFSEGSALNNLSSLQVFSIDQPGRLFGSTVLTSKKAIIKGNIKLEKTVSAFQIVCSAKSNCSLKGTVSILRVEFVFSGTEVEVSGVAISREIRFGRVLRLAGQDGCDTYRIPGLMTTANGTLIAVYDKRYMNNADLQADIDIGMSRSRDGGISWEPSKVIMDMGTWGSRPQSENGVGDPCILVDRNSGTIWVAALWINGFPGLRAWNCSEPGIDPAVTGQFMLVRSDDDGETWSQPVRITEQIKDPAWRLLLQGPGNGITLKEGTLVFPVQYRASDGIPYSTIIYSTDRGLNWKCGKGAKSNTTESQCVQLSDGSIMINMRDNRNSTIKDEKNGRAVAVTRDMGESWEVHPSSNSALSEPVCMASLISATVKISGSEKTALFFSNPNSRERRANMTIKASLDEGLTWPQEYSIEINPDEGYGYSCLTMVDNETIGILYEGVKELYFQVIPVKEILKINNKMKQRN